MTTAAHDTTTVRAAEVAATGCGMGREGIVTLTEQECIAVAELWGWTRQQFGSGRNVWRSLPIPGRHPVGLAECSDSGLPHYVNSPDGMARTLEAMWAKGWLVNMLQHRTSWQVEFRYSHPTDYRAVQESASNLPTAVNRAALAALEAS